MLRSLWSMAWEMSIVRSIMDSGIYHVPSPAQRSANPGQATVNLDFQIAPLTGVVERVVSKARIAEHMHRDVLLAELRQDGDPNPSHFSYIPIGIQLES